MGARTGAGAPLHVRGHLLPDGGLRDVWVVDGRLAFDEVPRAVTIADGGWVLPGLVDAHAHLGLHSPVRGTPRERAVASALAHRDAGVLVVREPGGPDRISATLGVRDGLPRIVTAGRFLAPPGGYLPGLAREVTAAELPTAVREEALVSGAWVKVVGDFPTDAEAAAANWDPATLRAAADAAHAAGARITAHATAPEVIEAAVLAGFDAVEHGTGMDPALVDLLAERGTAWIPTLMIDHALHEHIDRMAGTAAASTLTTWVERLPSMVAAAARAGVPVFAGTDAGMVPHGRVATEVARLRAAGLDPLAAIGAASWDARAWLGLPGLVEGAPADLTVHATDPRLDLGTLHRPVAVVLDGVALPATAAAATA